MHYGYYYIKVEPGISKTIEYDVAVYGGTPGGVTAAIQAARLRDFLRLKAVNRYGGLSDLGFHIFKTKLSKQRAVPEFPPDLRCFDGFALVLSQ